MDIHQTLAQNRRCAAVNARDRGPDTACIAKLEIHRLCQDVTLGERRIPVAVADVSCRGVDEHNPALGMVNGNEQRTLNGAGNVNDAANRRDSALDVADG
jgi:hypothetical protein